MCVSIDRRKVEKGIVGMGVKEGEGIEKLGRLREGIWMFREVRKKEGSKGEEGRKVLFDGINEVKEEVNER